VQHVAEAYVAELDGQLPVGAVSRVQAARLTRQRGLVRRPCHTGRPAVRQHTCVGESLDLTLEGFLVASDETFRGTGECLRDRTSHGSSVGRWPRSLAGPWPVLGRAELVVGPASRGPVSAARRGYRPGRRPGSGDRSQARRSSPTPVRVGEGQRVRQHALRGDQLPRRLTTRAASTSYERRGRIIGRMDITSRPAYTRQLDHPNVSSGTVSLPSYPVRNLTIFGPDQLRRRKPIILPAGEF
jgi:hypothetical protein